MNADRLSALVWLGVGLSAVYSSIALGLGTAREPGSGFIGFLASSFISLMALIILIQSIGKRAEKKRKLSTLWQGLRWKRPLLLCLIITGYILAFERLGFAISTFLFLIVLLKGMEALAWWKVLLLSALSTSLCYILLSFSLESTLPRGILGF